MSEKLIETPPFPGEDVEPRKFFRLMVIFPILGGGAISGFGVHRLLSGELGIAIFDFLVGITFFTLSFYTWRTGRETAARFTSAVISVVGPLVFLRNFDTTGIYWIYSSTIVIYYLVPYRWAIAFNVLMLAGVAVIYRNVDYQPVQFYSFLATIGLINGFSLLFALKESAYKTTLRDQSLRDELTGIANRRAFMERIGEVVSLNQRYDLQASLISLDIDRFKSINDTLGHAAGDRAIRGLARLIADNLRESDNVYRIGGDEFIIIAEGTGAEGATELTEKLRGMVENTAFFPDRNMTISLGIAVFRDGDDKDTWMARADEALYDAKAGGRNQVHISDAVA